MKKYELKYKVFLTNGDVLDKETKIANCYDDLHAKIRLGEWVKKKYSTNFSKLEIISCDQDIISAFTDLFGKGNSNPFGF